MTSLQALKNKNVLLGISGGIAAYKSAELVRRLTEHGAQVRVVMTDSATAFITPMTLQALSGNPVHTELLDAQAEAAMGHIELARWADVMLVAPASANTLAKFAIGLADNLLTTVFLATEADVLAAPAMNRLMWSHPATQHNIALLQQRGVVVLGPGTGDQACGEVGAGRMLEPAEIRDALAARLANAGGTPANVDSRTSLANTRLLITAGPTREPIDPVRYLSNRSSGKMGFAIAAAAASMGASVCLISGPVSLQTPANVERIDVTTAKQMYDAVFQRVDSTDIFIAVAAVADYRVTETAGQKMKKGSGTRVLELTENKDILADVAQLEPGPFCVGFAAETQQVEHYARDKLARKGLQMIAANQVAQPDNAVFNSDTNTLDVYWPDKGHAHIPTGSKTAIAYALLDLIAVQYARAKNRLQNP